MGKRKPGRPRVKSGPRTGFALRFWKARRALGMTQAEAAAALGVAVSTVARWETGASAPTGAAVSLLDSWIRKALEGQGGSHGGT